MTSSKENNLLYNEKYIFALDYFCESENKETDNFLEYDEILWQIAQTGCTYLEWSKLKELICFKMEDVMRKFQAKDPVDNFEEYLSYLHQLLTSKKDPPFSLQRICELILNVPSYYQNSHKKYVEALEKLVRIDSFSKTLSPEEYNEYVHKNISEIGDMQRDEPMQLVESSEIDINQ